MLSRIWSHQAWSVRDGGCHLTKWRCSFSGKGAGFVDEHKRHANRWDLESKQHLLLGIGSEKDQFEHKQIELASEHLGKYYAHVIQIERIPGGHLATSEQADTLATMIQMLANQKQRDSVGSSGWKERA